MSSDQEAQEDELLALQSIYDTYTLVVTDEGEVPGGQFAACLELPQPFHVKFSTSGQKGRKCKCTLCLQHLCKFSGGWRCIAMHRNPFSCAPEAR